MKNKIYNLFILIVPLVLICSCAQIVPLTGGAKDTEPPKLISSSPAQAAINFSENKVELVFNEYIKLNSGSQITVTPCFNEQPEITINNNKLQLTFNEKLKENTTYFFNFKNAISDITENNIAEELQIYFSTGNIIDSAFVNGKIVNAEDLKPISNLSVGLYIKQKDSIAFLEKPDYISQSNSNGEYKIPFVKKGEYTLIAIEDINKNKVYDIGEKIAFERNKLVLDTNLFVNLIAFKEESDKLFFKKIISLSPEKFLIQLNKKIDEVGKKVLLNSKKEVVSNYKIYHKPNSDSLIIILKNVSRDTFYFRMDNIAEDAKLISQSKEELQSLFKRGRYPFEIKSIINDKNNFPFYATLKFHSNFLISEINYSKISLQTDDKLLQLAEQNIQFLDDSIYINFKWNEQTSYNIVFYPGSVKDFFDRTNDTLKISFKTNAMEDLSKLTLNFSKCNSNKILQLINSKNECVFQKNINGLDKLKISRLLPDNYSLRLISDSNADGRFTSGNFIKKIQPEKLIENKEVIKLLPGWENELNLQDDYINSD
jgi:hypothetical protein